MFSSYMEVLMALGHVMSVISKPSWWMKEENVYYIRQKRLAISTFSSFDIYICIHTQTHMLGHLFLLFFALFFV